MSAVFHLNNKEAKRELKVNLYNKTLPFCSETKYIGVTLDRLLTFRWHLESLRKKLASRFALLRQLAVSGWGAGATTLRIATLALVRSTAEHCTPVWCRSAHTRLIDPAINNALRIVTGCLRPTQLSNPRRHPTCWASSQWSHTVSSRSGAIPHAMEPIHLHSALTRRVRMHGTSNRDIHLYPLHNNSSVHLTTTTYVQHSGWITSGMQSGWTTPQDFAFSFQMLAHTLSEWRHLLYANQRYDSSKQVNWTEI